VLVLHVPLVAAPADHAIVHPMSRLTDRRTRFVTWLKVLLPLVALGLLSTLFLLARTTDPDLAIRYSDVDVSELSKDQQVTGPAYAGITRDGASVSVTARTVRPQAGEPGMLNAATVAGRLELQSGTTADMTAPAAVIDVDGDLLRFAGGVAILSSDGYRFETETLLASLATTDIRAETPVRATGPQGTLDAGAMHVTQGEDGGYVAVFTGGVRLLYTPVQTEE
jgi:lipopolysaccharide export system protein LptC